MVFLISAIIKLLSELQQWLTFNIKMFVDLLIPCGIALPC